MVFCVSSYWNGLCNDRMFDYQSVIRMEEEATPRRAEVAIGIVLDRKVIMLNILCAFGIESL